MHLKPRHNYVVVTELPVEEEKTASGLYVPPALGNIFRQPIGLIHAIGPEVIDLKLKMKVLYSGNAGWKHTVLGKTYIFLPEREILGVIEE